MITTLTGKKIIPWDFRAGDMSLEELAHGLAGQGRYYCQSRYPLSVAQHAVNVSLLVDGTGHEMQALHHDDSEAVLGDMNKWLKSLEVMKPYRDLEYYVQGEFYRQYNCNPIMHPLVEKADRDMCRFEMVFGFGPKFRSEHPNYQPPDEEEFEYLTSKVGRITEWPWRRAKARFLTRHEELVQRRKYAKK